MDHRHNELFPTIIEIFISASINVNQLKNYVKKIHVKKISNFNNFINRIKIKSNRKRELI